MIIKGRIVDFPSRGEVREIREGYIVVDDKGKIVRIGAGMPTAQDEVVDYTGMLILPGFVDIHSHIPQLDARGKYAKDLLDWLNRYIFREEKRFEEEAIAREVSGRFFEEVLRNGITTVMALSTVHKRATDIAFQEAEKAGLRAIIGKTMMDYNSPEFLKEDTDQALKDSIELIEKWHGKDGRLFYALTPRFAVTSTEELLRRTGEAARKYDVYIQTHLSESPGEVELVEMMFPSYRSYTDLYYRTGILGPRSVMAHSIHLLDEEFELLKKTETKVAHCPAANLFLHSGRMDLKKMKDFGITLGLGSDVGAGPYFSPFQLMRDMYYLNQLSPSEAFHYATLGGARALSLDDKIGTLEAGKEADFVVIDPSDLYPADESIDEILSQLMFRGDDRQIRATYVRGRRLYGK